MNHLDVKHLLAAGLALAAIVATALWSWNTLADLFGVPEMQFRYALAALALLAVVHRLVVPAHRCRWQRSRHGCPTGMSR
jgi:hypothetical protein